MEAAKTCPNCKSSNVVRICYGKPAAKLLEESQQVKVLLGGCMVSRKKIAARSAAIGSDLYNSTNCSSYHYSSD